MTLEVANNIGSATCSSSFFAPASSLADCNGHLDFQLTGSGLRHRKYEMVQNVPDFAARF